MAGRTGRGSGPVITDPFGRVLDYVRISVTDRCNFRCTYCMPPGGIPWIPHDEIMSYEDILFLCGVLAALDVRKVRFTGGEPFVRKGFVPFLAEVRASFPGLRVAVTTNGTFLGEWAKVLSSLGLDSVNVSLDTLDTGKFARGTGGGDLRRVLDGIEALRSSGGVPMKVNTVVMRDFNREEIPELTAFSGNAGLLHRFIEFMPLDGKVWSRERFVSAEEILSLFPGPFPWVPEMLASARSEAPGPARYFINPSGQRVGIISAVSDHFCGRCNRLRISSTGTVRPCLFGNFGVSVIEGLRSRDGDLVRKGIQEAVSGKPREGGTGIPVSGRGTGERHMWQIGG